MNKRSFILLLAALLLGACDLPGVTEQAAFLSDNTVRLEIDGEKVFVYSPDLCQLAFNEKRCEFRAHTDTMLEYFVVSLDAIPQKAGEKVAATIIWSTPAGERSKENLTLEAKRIWGEALWLCDESRHYAAVVQVLE